MFRFGPSEEVELALALLGQQQGAKATVHLATLLRHGDIAVGAVPGEVLVRHCGSEPRVRLVPQAVWIVLSARSKDPFGSAVVRLP